MGVGVEGTCSPTVSMRLGNNDTAGQKFNDTLNQAKQEADDDDVSCPKTAPQPKDIGGCPGLCFDQNKFDDSIKAEKDRIDAQIDQDREISREPFESRLRGAQMRQVSAGDTLGSTMSRTTGDQLWTYGRNHEHPIDPLWPERGTLPYFTSNEKNAVLEAQGETQKQVQQNRKEEAYKTEQARAQSDQYQNWVNQGEQRASPGPMVTGIAVCVATGPYGCAVYSSAQTAPVVADAYNACKSGSTTDCVVGVAHATLAVVQDVGMIKSVQSKVPQVDPPSLPQSSPTTTVTAETTTPAKPSTQTQAPEPAKPSAEPLTIAPKAVPPTIPSERPGYLSDQALISRAKELSREVATRYLTANGKAATEAAIEQEQKWFTVGVLQGHKDGKLVTTVAVQDAKYAPYLDAAKKPSETFVEPFQVPQQGIRVEELKNKPANVHSEQVLADNAKNTGLISSRVATSRPGCKDACIPTLKEYYPDVRHVNPEQ
jgi:hypothetical protein